MKRIFLILFTFFITISAFSQTRTKQFKIGKSTVDTITLTAGQQKIVIILENDTLKKRKKKPAAKPCPKLDSTQIVNLKKQLQEKDTLLAKKDQELRRLRNAKQQVISEKNRLQRQIDSLNILLSTKNDKISRLRDSVNLLKQQITTKTTQLTNKQNQINSLKTQLHSCRDSLNLYLAREEKYQIQQEKFDQLASYVLRGYYNQLNQIINSPSYSISDLDQLEASFNKFKAAYGTLITPDSLSLLSNSIKAYKLLKGSKDALNSMYNSAKVNSLLSQINQVLPVINNPALKDSLTYYKSLLSNYCSKIRKVSVYVNQAHKVVRDIGNYVIASRQLKPAFSIINKKEYPYLYKELNRMLYLLNKGLYDPTNPNHKPKINQNCR